MCVEYNGVPVISVAPNQVPLPGWNIGPAAHQVPAMLGPRYGWTDANTEQNYFAPGPRPASSAQHHGQRGMGP